ncbi:MAG: iron-containing alcohol dehydrogenase [Gammaproteobacteria bacterium]|nr:iron-containing alcohol dehydrogenase [Gammaproteobacteria bacterium]
MSNLPKIEFGAGSISTLPLHIRYFGQRVMIVTGSKSFIGSAHWKKLLAGLLREGIEYRQVTISGEPSPTVIDEIVAANQGQPFDVVVGIGGGSVIDAAKAIAGLLPAGESVLNYLEDVGRGLPYTGPSHPFIAVPTTAGTGSEATKNSVLSEHGKGGFKKSFRHEMLVARIAVIDPDLMADCPRELTAAQGMDAFTQLLESYVSLKANPFTDALAWSGLEAVAEGFLNACEGGRSEPAQHGRAAMAYAALVSGITLAQVGLGSVHGLAQPFGSLFPIPHGIACGTTLAEATAVNLEALQQRAPNSPAIDKYARVARLLGATEVDDIAAATELVSILRAWTEQLPIPRLGHYGVTEGDIELIVANSRNNSMKTNPIELNDSEIATIVRGRI